MALIALRSQYETARKFPLSYSPDVTAGYGLRKSTLAVLVREGLAMVRLTWYGFSYILADVDQDEVARITETKAAYWATGA